MAAVTVHVAVPCALVVTVMVPLRPEPDPVAPVQLTDADDAPLVDQLKVADEPAVTELTLNAADVTEAGFTTVMLSDAVVVSLAAFLAVTVQVAVPAADVATVMLPDVPEPEPAPPVHATVADVALLVAQVKVADCPTVTDVLFRVAELTLGITTTLTVSLVAAEVVPAALVAVMAQVPVPADAPAVAVNEPSTVVPE